MNATLFDEDYFLFDFVLKTLLSIISSADPS